MAEEGSRTRATSGIPAAGTRGLAFCTLRYLSFIDFLSLSVFAQEPDRVEGESDWHSLDHRLMQGSERLLVGFEGCCNF